MRLPEVSGVLTTAAVAATVESICAVQLSDGCIPWFEGGHADPWDHVESAMALTVGGRRAEADRAFEWLMAKQRADGSWAAYYQDGKIKDATFDANVTAYVATGVWHRFLVEGDTGFLEELWPVVERAAGFALDLQRPGGEILWSRDATGKAVDYALLTGSSSMHTSLRCALAIAQRLGHERPDWELSIGALAHAVAHHPETFDPRERWSMDWYYPVLGGAVTGEAGHARMQEEWSTFVVDGMGVRCVSDRPWVTGAETCECALALHALGRHNDALALFTWMQYLRADDGSYWTGSVFPDDVHYPEERSTWTAAAVVLAADALSGATLGSGLFRGDGLPAGVDPETTCCEARANT